MASKNLYIKPRDLEVYDRAEVYGAERGLSLSELVPLALTLLMDTVSLRPVGYWTQEELDRAKERGREMAAQLRELAE